MGVLLVVFLVLGVGGVLLATRSSRATRTYTPGILVDQEVGGFEDLDETDQLEESQIRPESQGSGMTVFDPNYVAKQLLLARLNELAVLAYLKTYLLCADRAKIFDSPALKKHISGENEYLELQGFVRAARGVMDGAETGSTLGGPVGTVIGGIVGVFTSIATSIIDAIADDQQRAVLRKWLAAFAEHLGPPPSGLLHLAVRLQVKPPDLMNWEVDLHRYLYELASKAERAGWNLKGAPIVDRNGLNTMRNDMKINLVAGGNWGAFKAPVAFHWVYAFHPWLMFERLRIPSDVKKDFFSIYYYQLSTRTNPAEMMRFSAADWCAVMADAFGGEVGVAIFDIGHDPFWGSEDIQTKESDWQVNLSLPGAPIANWLISPPSEGGLS